MGLGHDTNVGEVMLTKINLRRPGDSTLKGSNKETAFGRSRYSDKDAHVIKRAVHITTYIHVNTFSSTLKSVQNNRFKKHHKGKKQGKKWTLWAAEEYQWV